MDGISYAYIPRRALCPTFRKVRRFNACVVGFPNLAMDGKRGLAPRTVKRVF